MITRTIHCARCKVSEQEPMPNAGWKGWMILQGVELNGDTNPAICPSCTNVIMNVIDREVANVMD